MSTSLKFNTTPYCTGLGPTFLPPAVPALFPLCSHRPAKWPFYFGSTAKALGFTASGQLEGQGQRGPLPPPLPPLPPSHSPSPPLTIPFPLHQRASLSTPQLLRAKWSFKNLQSTPAFSRPSADVFSIPSLKTERFSVQREGHINHPKGVRVRKRPTVILYIIDLQMQGI